MVPSPTIKIGPRSATANRRSAAKAPIPSREHVVDLEWFCTEDPTPDEPHEAGPAVQAQTWEQALQAAQPAARNEAARQVDAPHAQVATTIAPLAQTKSPAAIQAPRWTTVEQPAAPSWDVPRSAPSKTALTAEPRTDLDVFVDENGGDRLQNNLGMHGDPGTGGSVGVAGNPAIAPRWDAPSRDRTTSSTSQVALRPISTESQPESPGARRMMICQVRVRPRSWFAPKVPMERSATQRARPVRQA